MQISTLRAFLLPALFLLMILAETLWPKRQWVEPRWKRVLFHGLLAAANTFWTRFLLVGPVLLWVQLVHEYGWGLSRVLDLSGWKEIVLTVVFFDGFNYWWHRWNHVLPILWRFHKAHHLDTEVDTTTALRFHPGELLISYGFKSLLVLVWGPSLAAYVLFESLITAYAQFHHTNIDFPDGFEHILRWVHITPRLHAAHHTVSLRTRDSNYSTIFSVWDRIFGSLKEPDFRELRYLGLKEGRKTALSISAFLAIPFQKTGLSNG